MLATSLMNKELLPEDCIDASRHMTTLLLGHAGGSERLYSNIDRLGPGAKSCKFHSHSLQEEFFIVLRGHGVLRLGDKTFQVCEGSFFSKPAGKGIAHQFINDSDDEILEILDVGIPDPNDVIEYPDEGVTYHKAEKRAYKNGELVPDWSSDPN